MQNQLFVGNLAFSTTKEDLEAFFSEFGTITEVKIPQDRDTGRVRGFAFVTFETQEQAEAALKKDGAELNGRPIRVNVAEAKKGGGAGGRSGGRSSGGNRGHGGRSGQSSDRGERSWW